MTAYIDTILYDLSIPAISRLQSGLFGQNHLMQLISVVLDPKYAFLVYSPVAFLIDQRAGKKLILTTVLTEWLNMILKWLLHGERPYWYVHSSGHFDPKEMPIHQFPVTCELGPGHPSGHSMVTAAVWYIILESLLQFYNSHLAPALGSPGQPSVGQEATLEGPKKEEAEQQQQGISPPASPSAASDSALAVAKTAAHFGQAHLGAWILYSLLLVTISVSRVFLGCHFPHQCLLGALLGFLVARFVSRSNHLTAPINFVICSLFLITSAFLTFAVLQASGFDPSWTIALAMKHCVKREYIHLDTAPFFSIMRYSGFALGTGLGLMLPIKSYIGQFIVQVAPSEGQRLLLADAPDKESKGVLSSRQLSWFSIKILVAMLLARLVDNLGLFISHAYLPAFYSGAFVAYTAFSFAFVNL